jgi:tRNA dimethylallyltransferase
MEIIQKKDDAIAVERPKVAVLLGPTAVGKTGVALELAREMGAEIVNADSLQLYRQLDIGTAKPTAAERALVPHHLLDVVDPPDLYDAARFSQEGRAILAALHDRGVIPLVVGGTGLYIKALLSGLFVHGDPDPCIRRQLRQELTDLGLSHLHERLRRLDPASAWRLHPRDTYRILRALEVIQATGHPLSALQEAHQFRDSPYRVLKLGLRRPREELNRRIEARVEAMLAQGWLDEVQGLISRYPPHLKPFQALGYRHLIAFLQGRWGWEEAIELLKRDTRRYAKRQLTWFKADSEVRWNAPDQVKEMLLELRGFFFRD